MCEPDSRLSGRVCGAFCEVYMLVLCGFRMLKDFSVELNLEIG
jgi:hypothetical protein